MVSGMFSASLRLPHALEVAVDVFPLKALADGLRAAYDPAARGVPVADIAVLVLWSTGGFVVARRCFRWTP